MPRRGSRAKTCNGQTEDVASFQRKLSISETEKEKLKADLQAANGKIEEKDGEIDSLQHQLSALEQLYKECVEAQEALKQRDEEMMSLKQNLHAQQGETERVRTSAAQMMEASEVEDMEEMWKTKVSQLEELLHRETKKRRVRTIAHVETLSLLTAAESALKDSQLRCDALEQLNEECVEAQEALKQRDEEVEVWKTKVSQLEELLHKDMDTLFQLIAALTPLRGSQLRCDSVEEELLKQLADIKENHRRELTEQESFSKELSGQLQQSQNELLMLSESWRRSDQPLKQEERKLEEVLLAEEMWKKEEAHQKEEIQNIQLQEPIQEKEREEELLEEALVRQLFDFLRLYDSPL